MASPGRGLTLLTIAVLCAGHSLGAQNPPPRDQAAPAASSQVPAQTGTGVVRGRVVVAGSDAPLRRAEIRLGSYLPQARTTVTDEDGRFEFRNVLAGSYTVTAGKPGYLTDRDQQRAGQLSARRLEVASGQLLEHVDFQLPRASAITVRVLDAFGEALTGAEIQLQRYRDANGERRLDHVSTPVGSRSTNDLGELRVFGLSPGEYYVLTHVRNRLMMNTPLGGRAYGGLTYASSYYPGTTSLTEAQPIAVGEGQELSIEIVQVLDVDSAKPATLPTSQPAVREPGTSRSAGRIRGRVTAAETGTSLARVQIQIGDPTSQLTRVVATDAQGRYDARDLPAGRYLLSAARNGYVQLRYGSRQPLDPGQWLELKAGETLDDIDFRLPKTGAVTVRVTDDAGDPVLGAQLELLQPRVVGGTRVLTTVPQPGLALTDDRGDVRLFGAPPGEYYVRATMMNPALSRMDKGQIYAPTYYPGTALFAEAIPVSIGAGSEPALTFSMMSARAARITGIIRRSDGSPIHRTQASFVQPNGFSSTTYMPVVRSEGTFSIGSVFPGEYTFIVADRVVERPEMDEFATLRVTVADEDVSGLVVTMTRGGSARGRLTFDGGTPDDVGPGAIRLRADLSASAAEAPQALMLPRPDDATWDGDWTFAFEGLSSRRVLRVSTPGWFLKAVMLDGRDVTDTPLDFDGGREVKGLEVILTRKRSGITGDVRDSRGQLTSNYTIVLFPEDDRQWTPDSRFIASGRGDQNGRFRIDGMPDGAYLITAVEFLEGGGVRDPEILRQLRPRATRMTLGEGETRTVSLRLQGR